MAKNPRPLLSGPQIEEKIANVARKLKKAKWADHTKLLRAIKAEFGDDIPPGNIRRRVMNKMEELL